MMQQMTTSVSTAGIVTALACTDITQEAAFFSDKLGMQVNMFSDMPGYGVVSAGHGTYLMCYERPSTPHCDATAATFVVDDIQKSVTELRSNGVQFEEYDLPDQGIKTVAGIATQQDGSMAAWFKDPAGNLLGLTQLTANQKRMMADLM